MSILNRTNDGFYNVLLVLYHTVLESGTIEIDGLLKRCAPKPIDSKGVNNTLKKWLELGLFSKVEEGNKTNIVIPEDYRLKQRQSSQQILDNLPKILRTIVFSEKNNNKFWDAEKSRSADYSRALSWLLCQDIYSIQTKSHDAISALESRQLGENAPQLIVKNDTRWNGLKEWALALGFAWESGQLVIDPTLAVRQSMPDMMKKKETLSVKEFLHRLAVILPVLDNGKYREEVEQNLNFANWKKPEPKHLSMSLSRALRRLEAGNVIKCESKSDSGDNFVNLTGRSYTTWGHITHIYYC